jgi:hypothetical protein
MHEEMHLHAHSCSAKRQAPRVSCQRKESSAKGW